MVVYLDILFFINLVMNYIVLILTSGFGSIYGKRYRFALGAIFGSIYGVFTFFNTLEFLTFWLIKILVCMLMTWISYGKKNLMKNTILVFLVSFVVAGFLMAMAFLSKNPKYMILNGVPYIDISLNILVGTFILCYVFLCIMHRGIYKNKTEHITNIIVSLKDKKLKIPTYIDSGNVLRDIITGKPIIVVNAQEVRKILPNEFKFLAETEGFMHLEFLSPKKNQDIKVRIIHYSTASGSNEMMLAFTPDEIIDGRGKRVQALIGIATEEIKLAGAKAIMGVY